MRGKNRGLIPPELARKISPWMVNIGEMAGPVGKSALTAFVAFFLSGGIGLARYPDPNGFMYLFGPWVCPTLVALLMSVVMARKSFRAIRGSPLGEPSYITDDPAVMRLNEIMNSDEIRRHLWREALKLSTVLFAILATAAVFLRDSLEWALPSPQNGFLLHARRSEPGSLFWGGLFLSSMLMFMILFSDCWRWGLMTWAKRESVVDKSPSHK